MHGPAGTIPFSLQLNEKKCHSGLKKQSDMFILVVSFYMNLTRKLMWETERNSLIKSAYTDELTQLHNRRYCMEYINKIKEGNRGLEWKKRNI